MSPRTDQEHAPCLGVSELGGGRPSLQTHRTTPKIHDIVAPRRRAAAYSFVMVIGFLVFLDLAGRARLHALSDFPIVASVNC
jgi:hypothetical protein